MSAMNDSQNAIPVQPQPDSQSQPAPAQPPVQVAHPETTQAGPQAAGVVTTDITYSVGLLTPPTAGTISFDGVNMVTLIDKKTGNTVFSMPIQHLGKVTRVEYALYVNVPGMKRVTIMFGNPRRYLTENALAMPYGTAGAVTGVVRSNQMNQRSGLQQWALIFKQYGKIRNFSPNKVVVLGLIGGVVIFIIAALISLINYPIYY